MRLVSRHTINGKANGVLKRVRCEFLLSKDHKINGGVKDTELNELTVKP